MYLLSFILRPIQLKVGHPTPTDDDAVRTALDQRPAVQHCRIREHQGQRLLEVWAAAANSRAAHAEREAIIRLLEDLGVDHDRSIDAD